MKFIYRSTLFSVLMGISTLSLPAQSNESNTAGSALAATTGLSSSMTNDLRIDSPVPDAIILPSAVDDTLHKDSTLPAGNKYFWLQAGVQADELFYPNARLHIGYGKAYAILSWNEDCCLSHIRFGIGYVRPLANKWQLHGTATLGFTKARYPQSATLPEVHVKNSLYKLAALASRHINRHFSVQAGLVMNALYTRYKSPDQQGHLHAIAAGALLTDGMDGDAIYRAVKPPYTLFNTYKKESTGNWKGWIGGEIGIYYTLRLRARKK